MRKISLAEKTMSDLATLNRGQSMLLNLYIKGFTHAELSVYTDAIELIVYMHTPTEQKVAEMIIRSQMADGDTFEFAELENNYGPFVTIKWRGNLIETEKE